jgi:microsomal epoxide hydrolase
MPRFPFRFAALGLSLAMFDAVAAPAVTQHFFQSSDGVRLHYREAGQGALTLVFVPGWTMPGAIWEAQLNHFAARYRVLTFDPRGQGESQIARDGYTAERRAQDIAELIGHAKANRVVLVGWSLGVLESLQYTRAHGTDKLAALVLVDNSIGEEPPPKPDPTFLPRLKKDRRATSERFVRNMYRTPQSNAYLQRITEQSLRTPTDAAVALLSYTQPRTYWKETAYQVDKPVLYVVSERFRGQAGNFQTHRPDAATAVFERAGHALFVDEAARFNALVESFVNSLEQP